MVGVDLETAVHEVPGLGGHGAVLELVAGLLLGHVGQPQNPVFGVDVFDLVEDLGLGRPEDVEDEAEQLDVGLGAFEENLLLDELEEGAADGPDVHGRVVLARVEHDLGRAVVARDHVLGLVLVGLVADLAGQPEVAEPHLAGVVEQNVVGLDVAVHDVVLVQVVDPQEDLEHDVLDVVLGHVVLALLDHRVEVEVHELGDHVDLDRVMVLLDEKALQVQDVLVATGLEDYYFAEHLLGVGDVLDFLQFFDRHHFLRVGVLVLEDRAVGALPDLGDLLVARGEEFLGVIHLYSGH